MMMTMMMMINRPASSVSKKYKQMFLMGGNPEDRCEQSTSLDLTFRPQAQVEVQI